MRIAAQLYTVRDLLAQDYIGTLRRVRSVGYEHVELAGHGSFTPLDLSHALADCGLTACSEHCPIERLESDLAGAIDDAHVLDVRYIVCPYLPEERRRDEAGWQSCAELLNRAGKICREHSIQLCYHNHSFEFVDVNGHSALELLLAETDPDFVKMELDTYWVKHGSGDPAAWLARLPNRCPLLHLKDMASDAERSFAPVGTGILDWRAIFAAAPAAGVQWGIVEQDICPTDPVECLRLSRDHLSKHFG